MDYIIREMRKEEYYLLNDFLYEAIYIPDGIEPPHKSVLRCPELQEYIVEFGKVSWLFKAFLISSER